MAQNSNRNMRRSCRRRNANATVITSNTNGHALPETVAEEIYSGAGEEILMLNCCDPLRGCAHLDARARCSYWPRFAHPRWLTCRELYNRRNF